MRFHPKGRICRPPDGIIHPGLEGDTWKRFWPAGRLFPRKSKGLRGTPLDSPLLQNVQWRRPAGDNADNPIRQRPARDPLWENRRGHRIWTYSIHPRGVLGHLGRGWRSFHRITSSSRFLCEDFSSMRYNLEEKGEMPALFQDCLSGRKSVQLLSEYLSHGGKSFRFMLY